MVFEPVGRFNELPIGFVFYEAVCFEFRDIVMEEWDPNALKFRARHLRKWLRVVVLDDRSSEIVHRQRALLFHKDAKEDTALRVATMSEEIIKSQRIHLHKSKQGL